MEASERYSQAVKDYQEMIQKTSITLSSYCKSHHINSNGMMKWMSRNKITVKGLKPVTPQPKQVVAVSKAQIAGPSSQQIFPLSFKTTPSEEDRDARKTTSLLKGVSITFPDGVIVSIKETGWYDLGKFVAFYNTH